MATAEVQDVPLPPIVEVNFHLVHYLEDGIWKTQGPYDKDMADATVEVKQDWMGRGRRDITKVTTTEHTLSVPLGCPISGHQVTVFAVYTDGEFAKFYLSEDEAESYCEAFMSSTLETRVATYVRQNVPITGPGEEMELHSVRSGDTEFVLMVSGSPEAAADQVEWWEKGRGSEREAVAEKVQVRFPGTEFGIALCELPRGPLPDDPFAVPEISRRDHSLYSEIYDYRYSNRAECIETVKEHNQKIIDSKPDDVTYVEWAVPIEFGSAVRDGWLAVDIGPDGFGVARGNSTLAIRLIRPEGVPDED